MSYISKALSLWIDNEISERQTTNYEYCAGYLRMLFKDDTGISVGTEELVEAMERAGYECKRSRGHRGVHDYYFNISNASRAVQNVKMDARRHLYTKIIIPLLIQEEAEHE